MRHVFAALVGASIAVAGWLAPAARADSCQGDLYCDGKPPHLCGDRNNDGVIECLSPTVAPVDIPR